MYLFFLRQIHIVDIVCNCSGGSSITEENEARVVEPLGSPKNDAVASKAPDGLDSRIQAARDRFLARKSKK